MPFQLFEGEWWRLPRETRHDDLPFWLDGKEITQDGSPHCESHTPSYERIWSLCHRRCWSHLRSSA